jgi:hypothetical protein
MGQGQAPDYLVKTMHEKCITYIQMLVVEKQNHKLEYITANRKLT